MSAGLPDGFTWQAPQCETPEAPNYWHQPGITAPPIRASCNPLVSRLVFTAGLVHAGLDLVRPCFARYDAQHMCVNVCICIGMRQLWPGACRHTSITGLGIDI